jgi:phytoene dehydrogenase-like protein
VADNEIDAVVVGAGPNGLVAAARLAEAGRSVLVVEAYDRIGGGTRSSELTLPGFVHDVCSAIHPLGASSPAFAGLDLAAHGLRWCYPEVDIAHPLEGGRAGVVVRDVASTAAGLGADGPAWIRHIGSHAARWDELSPMLLGSLVSVPRHPVALTKFGLPALAPARWLAERWFETDEARALMAGCAAHAFLPLEHVTTASFGLVLLASAHAVGWPVAKGGSQRIADALGAHITAHGGRIETGRRVTSLDELPRARAVLFDVAPRDLATIAGDRLPERYARRLRRYRYGAAAFKIDYALDGPMPWTNERCAVAGTVHVAGDASEVAAAEAAVGRGEVPERPFVLVAQQSVVDPSRAPAGKHTLWTYCHVPNGCTVDMTDAMESQIERFAPGFRDLVLARHVGPPAWYQGYNPAYVGGDIGGGANDGLQMFLRPVAGRAYRTPDPELFLCSASTPPGGGVHGMCGYHAANAALRGPLR